MPVLTPTDLMRSLLASFSEHHCDFGAVPPIARTLREKIDWDEVRGGVRVRNVAQPVIRRAFSVYDHHTADDPAG
jgi:hypothetical protein